VDSKIVNKGLRTEVRPLLETLGFSQFTSRSAWRYADRRIDVVNFQSFNAYNAGVLGVTTYSFALNLGCFYPEIPYSDGEIKMRAGALRPEEYSCPFRGRLRRSIPQSECDDRSIWYVDEGGRCLAKVLHDVRMVIARDLPHWFDRVATRDAALAILLTEEEQMEDGLWGFGRMDSPHRNYLTGYFELTRGNVALAQPYLKAALASGCYEHVKSRLEADIAAAG